MSKRKREQLEQEHPTSTSTSSSTSTSTHLTNPQRWSLHTTIEPPTQHTDTQRDFQANGKRGKTQEMHNGLKELNEGGGIVSLKEVEEREGLCKVLQNVQAEARAELIHVMALYLRNVLHCPQGSALERTRKIPLSNARFQKSVLAVPGGELLLTLCGFKKQTLDTSITLEQKTGMTHADYYVLSETGHEKPLSVNFIDRLQRWFNFLSEMLEKLGKPKLLLSK
eukprot:TRINITY_DN5884_c0_g1_i1.p1 TRINITY_DN5884_c0_g1~~TRINITY_DN5884_c0_g1_i1.p1  ORF type:complete len:233 (-),score=36.14 TRINITY_DN5884_c0_g1_i1:84-755(-)